MEMKFYIELTSKLCGCVIFGVICSTYGVDGKEESPTFSSDPAVDSTRGDGFFSPRNIAVYK
jgi:hypothetical protein